MPYAKKKKRTRYKALLVVFLLLTVAALAAAGGLVWHLYKEEQARQAAALEEETPRIVIPEGYFAAPASTPAEVQKSNYMIKLLPGTDFYRDGSADAGAVSAELDGILAQIEGLNMSTVLLDTRMPDGRVVFSSRYLESTPVDAAGLLAEKAAERGLNFAAVYHLTGVQEKDGPELLSYAGYRDRYILEDAVEELAAYSPSMIELDDYYGARDGRTYAVFLEETKGEGDFEEWLRGNAAFTVERLSARAKEALPGVPVGLTAASVWANAEGTEGGSETAADFQSLIDGHADVRAMVEEKAVDFIDVAIGTSRANGSVPFKTAVSWWGEVCKASGMPMYVTHKGENLCSAEAGGWEGTDELALQAADANNTGAWYGSAFTGLSRLAEDPQGGTQTLLDYLAGSYDEEYLRTQLTFTVPAQRSFVTYEETQQFRGHFDPMQEVTLNGEKIEPSEKGGFSLWEELEIGNNTFTFTHKGKNIVYNIERKIVIFQEVSPAGKTLKMAGGAELGVSCTAYRGSDITATLNGQTVSLDEVGGDEVSAESKYTVYEGYFTLPRATAKEQEIGQIAFSGTYEGVTQGAAGAAVVIDKLPDAVDPDEATGKEMPMATVGLTYANTYPYNTTPSIAQAILYQLPYGTKDIVVGENGDFYNLRSGKTVKKEAVSLSTEVFEGNNTITQLEYGIEGNDTVIRLTMDWRSPFSLSLSPYPSTGYDSGSKQNYYFQGDTVTLLFDYVTNLGEGAVSGTLDGSPIFSGTPALERVKNQAYNIYQYKMTLHLNQTGRYYGCHAMWEDNTLVLRFNHPAYGSSLSGMTVVIDPGHGGSDNGNMAGRDVVEKDVNYWQAMALGQALENAGANVVYTRTDDRYVSLQQRVQVAHNYMADLFISCHQNSAGSNAQPHGVQVYYNAPFSQPLAMYVQGQLAPLMGDSKWNYWNGPNANYNFVVTRERQYPSILIEFGFLSNPYDEALAMSEAHWQQMADAVVQGVIEYYNAYN